MTAADRKVRVWGIIPAAGLSRRMGRAKQLLPYQGSTLAATVTRTLLDADVGGVVVVTRSELLDDLQLPNDARVRVAQNDDPDSEMIDSVRVGLVALSQFQPGDDDGVLVVPADMPTLSAQTCRTCIATYLSNPSRIVVATYQGQRGHPIVFPLALRHLVFQLHGGLRMLPRTCPDQVLLVHIDDPGVSFDVDLTGDYESL
jgi:molybdenum cofactor cytidylyltransferase